MEHAADLLVTGLAALVGAVVLDRLRLPAGPLVGAMLAVAAVSFTDLSVAPLPQPLRFLAFVVVGWQLGSDISSEIVPILRANAGVIAGLVALLLIGGIVLAVLAWIGGVDGVTAFLAASPGGLSYIAALTAVMGGDPSVVVTVHVVRVGVTTALLPLCARVTQRRRAA